MGTHVNCTRALSLLTSLFSVPGNWQSRKIYREVRKHRSRKTDVLRLLLLLACASGGVAIAADAPRGIARNLQFSHLNAEKGLSSEFVHDVAQDGRGYMWIATQSGLNSFDGHDVRIYESVSGDLNSLSHNFIWSLHIDGNGDLWIGTERGVNRYDAKADSFVRQPWNNLNLNGFRVRKIIQDQQDNFWLGTLGNGVLRISRTGELTQFIKDDESIGSLPDNRIIDLLADRRGQIWVGTDGGGLARFDDATEQFITYRHDAANLLTITSDQIRSLYEDSVGNIWIGTAPGGLNRLDPGTGRVTRFTNDPDNSQSLPAGQISAVYQDNQGTLWVGSENGLAEWRPALNGFVRYATEDGNPLNSRIAAMMQDASGVLWIAGQVGVSAWNYFSDTFKYFSTVEGYLTSNLVTSVDESSTGILWVGTYGGGLTRIDPLNDVVTHYRHDKREAGSLPDDRVMTVHVDANDVVWAGTRSGGLVRLTSDGSRFDQFRHDPDDEASLSGDAISSILSDGKGRLWIGVFDGGLNVAWQGNPDNVQRFRHDPDNPNSLSGDRVLELTEDRTGKIWIGTEDAGLNLFDPVTRSFTVYDLEDLAQSESVPHGTPWEIKEARDGSLYLGTLGQGLLQWTPGARQAGGVRFRQLGAVQGLASEIYGIIENRPYLWLSSNRGLFQYNTVTGEVRRFDNNNGLRNNEFNQGAALRSRTGQYFFGTTAGLVGFFPGELPENTRAPMVSLTASSRTEPLARTGTGQAIPHIDLDYFDAFISFDFVALDFMSPDKNLYRYRMEGFDSEWNNAGHFRRAVYSSLPPGNYVFQVQASNNDRVWNLEGGRVEVHVVPPPWSTWWAYMLYAAIFVALMVWYALNQRAKQQTEIASRIRLEHLVDARTAELADKNNDLMLLNQRLEQASVTDALTGLHNRRFVDEHIAAEVSKLQRQMFEDDSSEEAPQFIFLMMIDLDGFKSINDAFGHHAGDRALLEVKERLLASCRQSDVVIRWGGDEFLIIGTTRTMEGAEQFADKVRQTLAAPGYDVGDGNTGRLSGSIGVSAIPFTGNKIGFASWEQVCSVADMGAYIAKGSGRNAWVSITGTPLITQVDFAGIKENLANLVKERKLRIVSSSSENSDVIPLNRPGRDSK